MFLVHDNHQPPAAPNGSTAHPDRSVLVGSYLSAVESHEAVRHYDTLCVDTLQDMERTLQLAFSSRQRQRHHRQSQHPHTTMDDNAAAAAAAMVTTTTADSNLEQLVEQHTPETEVALRLHEYAVTLTGKEEQATVERYKLFLLPSRG